MKIDEEFQSIIPPLTPEEFQQLEANILAEGIRDSLVTWQGVLIDGHNRYNIATKHGLSYNTNEKQFDNRNDVIIWIIENQFGRRNLNKYQRSVLALPYKEAIKKRAKQKQVEDGKNLGGTLCQKSDKGVIHTSKEVAKIAGVSHDTIAKVEKIEQQATPEMKQKLNNGEISINEAHDEIKKEEKENNLKLKKEIYEIKLNEAQEKKQQMKVDIYNTNKKFRIIYADPCWNYNDKQDTTMLGGAVKHYETMTIEQLCKLPVKNITEKNAILFLWVTSPLLEESFEVIKEWGFKYKTSFVWDKIKHNMGHYNSVRHEFLLLATKGSCVPDNKKLYDSVQSIERNERHSEKPIEFLNIIDDLYLYGDRLEMFARDEKKPNWNLWGNEV